MKNKTNSRVFVGIPSDINEKNKDHFLSGKIIESILQAGGIPLPLSCHTPLSAIPDLLKKIDRVLITGGAFDIPPSFYGEKKKQRIDSPKPTRSHFEISLIREAIRLKKPVLGICGGMQAINVALGGTLYQDIRSQLPYVNDHEQPEPKNAPFHFVNLVKKSKLQSIFEKDRIKVNSTHHQAVKDVGKGLVVSAFSDDGIIEAIELDHPKRFALGVQWHPEERIKEQKEIFKELIDKK